MTEEKYQELKTQYVSNIKNFMSEMGNVFPHISIFGNHKDENETKDAIIHIEIPDILMSSEHRKELFVQQVLPSIAKEINEKFIPYGVAWTSEAWVRESGPGDVPENWKDIPIKKEILLISLEFTHKKEALIYEIKRLGKQVNEEGNLIDKIDLLEEEVSITEPLQGRFSGLLEKFIVS